MPSLMIKCPDCKKVKEICARSLCRPCYKLRWKNGTLDTLSKKDRKPTIKQQEAAAKHKKEYMRQYRLDNRDKLRKQNRDWVLANPDKMKEMSRRHYTKNYEAIRNGQRKFYYENREKAVESSRKYALANKEKLKPLRARYQRIRSLRKLGVETDEHTILELHEYWRSKGINPKYCTYCDKYYNKWKSSVGDHVVPISKGGPDVMENIVPCCGTCNSSKSGKILYEEWIPLNERVLAA
jgi:hypothetical protein